ncbi:MAG: Elongation factor P [Parcubacteria group bacterium GW2011_GWC2_32_10]|nr:MAG: Elongation factor P [Parcubacteria group bacterium GW2011_GWC2_32_10]
MHGLRSKILAVTRASFALAKRASSKRNTAEQKKQMLTHTDLKKGTQFIFEDSPFEILESQLMKMAQRRPVMQCKIKNLLNGSVQERNFQQGDVFREADLEKINIKFLYSTKGQYFFCKENNPADRFSFTENQVGRSAKFLKPNSIVTGIVFNEKIINIVSPIKVQLKVKESAPGVKGDRAQGGTKEAILESGASIQVPLFIEEGDIIEINTELEQYVKRA